MKLIKSAGINLSELISEFNSRRCTEVQYLSSLNTLCDIVQRRNYLSYVCFHKKDNFIFSEFYLVKNWYYHESPDTSICNFEIGQSIPRSLATASLDRKFGDFFKGIEFFEEEKIHSIEMRENRTDFVLTTKWLHLNDL